MKRIFKIDLCAVIFSTWLTGCVSPIFNPEIAYSRAWWETEILKCILSGACLDRTPPSVTVGNLSSSHNSILESGFIVGTANDDLLLSRIEISLDSGPFFSAVGTLSWRYQIPSSLNKAGLHSVQVRSVDFSGNSSGILNYTFRKGNNKDVNGDGFPDIAIVASLFSTTRNGDVYLYYGIGMNGFNPTNTSMANVVILGDSTASFGYALQLGDVNGDGYADLVAGGSFEYGGANGKVYVFQSQGTNGIIASSFANANLTLDAGPSTTLGYSISLGDVNGDGILDIAASGYVGAGLAQIYHGGLNGVSPTPNTSIIGPGSNFGSAVRLGDLNGDGFSDLIVNGNTFSASAGQLWIFHSGSGGISAVDTSSTTLTLTGVSSNDSFGISMETGDVNGDGYEDLIAASVGYSGNTGRVYTFHGSPGGISAVSPGGANQTLTGATASESFGNGLALGDVNGDGFLDLAAGSTGFSAGLGKTTLFHSTGTSISATASATILGETAGDGFGLGAFADFNGDGYADWIAGSAGNSNSAGRAYLFYSPGASGLIVSLATSANLAISGYNLPGPTGSLFGQTFSH
ncbi:FG-GAP repeat protein [Leptospira sp. 201903071]|uniref:FG-GAP-like repeat-containing protein n=1 Tax=Leptospira ainazelensis TaxID=2810034 RepID=UPI0019667B4B|nr:FG-GAP-like repeat-containing protein [Leptospira ainazelensis]MBM9498674.1 FG-GAP repeat protein [Leptospira ainazelensis]